MYLQWQSTEIIFILLQWHSQSNLSKIKPNIPHWTIKHQLSIDPAGFCYIFPFGLWFTHFCKTSLLTFFSSDSLNCPNPGTEKVRQAQDCKHLYVVNPDWLWSCLERWERVEEQLYPLKEDYSKTPRLQKSEHRETKSKRSTLWGSPALIRILFSSLQGATVRRRCSKRSARRTNASSSPSWSSPNPSLERRRSGPTTRWRGSSSGGVLRCHAPSPRRRVPYCSRIKGSNLVSGNVRKSRSSFSAAQLQNYVKEYLKLNINLLKYLGKKYLKTSRV